MVPKPDTWLRLAGIIQTLPSLLTSALVLVVSSTSLGHSSIPQKLAGTPRIEPQNNWGLVDPRQLVEVIDTWEPSSFPIQGMPLVPLGSRAVRRKLVAGSAGTCLRGATWTESDSDGL